MTIATIRERERLIRANVLPEIKKVSGIEFRVKAGPEVLDIWEPTNIEKAAKIIKQGGPIGFAGFGVYGIGGVSKTFVEKSFISPYGTLPSIEEIKKRNFRTHPPVAMASWSVIENVTAWEQMCDRALGIDRQQVIKVIKETYDSLPLILVLPTDSARNNLLPFATPVESTGKETLSHAFLCLGPYRPWLELAQRVEEETNEIFLCTSANPHRLPSFTSSKEVAEVFPRLPLVLADLKFDDSAEKIEWCSHNIYSFVNFPESIDVLRLGNEYHGLMVKMMLEADLRPNFEFSNLNEILTDRPPIDSLEIVKKILG